MCQFVLFYSVIMHQSFHYTFADHREGDLKVIDLKGINLDLKPENMKRDTLWKVATQMVLATGKFESHYMS